MHTRDLTPWLHPHIFDEGSPGAERGTRAVVAITAAMMVVEILSGWWFNSMALLADGWHMSSHVLALGLSAAAYVAARRYARDPRFTWGAWKIEVLSAYTGGLLLIGIAGFMIVESIERLLVPSRISFDEAITVSILGFLVNAGCAIVLARSHGNETRDHTHPHTNHGSHHRHHHSSDLNLRSAYLHVIVDALTSILAIVALTAGKFLGWTRLDPAMGILGAFLVAAWSWDLLRQTSSALLDAEMDKAGADAIRGLIEAETGEMTRVIDLHIWRVGKERYSCVVGLVTANEGLTPDEVKRVLACRPELIHVSVEIHWCPDT